MYSLIRMLLFLTVVFRVCIVDARDVPEFGLMLNDDGDYSFVFSEPQASAQAIRVSVDALAGTPVKTLMYSVGAGSDTLYYPTRIASVVGWRKTRTDELADPQTAESRMWSKRIEKIKNGMVAGIDPIRITVRASAQGRLVFCAILSDERRSFYV